MGGGGGLIGGIVDTVKGVFGGETRAEKEAKAAAKEQKKSLLAMQQEETAKLDKRKADMERAKRGRASLLSGTEAGIVTEELKKTLG